MKVFFFFFDISESRIGDHVVVFLGWPRGGPSYILSPDLRMLDQLEIFDVCLSIIEATLVCCGLYLKGPTG